MTKELLTMAERIKFLREKLELTQAEIARRLGISRAGVNAWEMGLSCPSTFYLVELSRLFHVSTDYLLGTDTSNTLDVSGITEREYQLVYELVQYFRSGH